MCDLIRGAGTVRGLSFNMNAAQFSTFDPGVLNGTILTVSKKATRTTLASTIVGIDSYNSFIGARQSIKVVSKYSRLSILGEIDSMNSSIRLMGGSHIERLSGDLMVSSTRKPRVAVIPSEQAAPSRITALLLSIFHREDNADTLCEYNSIASVFLVLGISKASNVDLAIAWDQIVRLKGMCRLFSAISISRVKEIEELRLAFLQSDNERRLCNIYLLARSITMARASIKQVMITVASILSGKKVPSALKHKNYNLRNEPVRAYRIIEDVASVLYGLRPFTYGSRIRSRFASAVRNISILSVPIHKLRAVADDSESWERFVHAKKTDVVTRNAARTRHLFSHMRRTWTAYYDSRLSAIIDTLCMLRTCHNVSNNILTTKWEALESHDILARALVNEYAFAVGKALAFRFSRVKLSIEVDSASDVNALEGVVDRYRDHLCNCSYSDINAIVDVDMRMGQWDANSYLKKHCLAVTHELTSKFELGDRGVDAVLKMVKSVYEQSAQSVKGAIVESIQRDYSIVNNVSKPEVALPEVKRDLIPISINMDQIFANLAAETDSSGEDKEWASYRSNVEFIRDEISDYLLDVAEALTAIISYGRIPAKLKVDNKAIFEEFKSAIKYLCGKDAEDMSYAINANYRDIILRVAKYSPGNENNSIMS